LNKKILTTSLVTALSLSFLGCGGGGGGSSDSQVIENSTKTGSLVDAPVQGLKYTTPTYSGFTDANGNFTYKKGESITFYLGNLTLGTVPAKETITPLTLAGDTDLNNISAKAVAIARILQSLDSDSGNANTLILPNTLEAMNISALDLEIEADLSTILAEAQTITLQPYVLKDAVDATNDMKSFLQTYLYNGTYTGSALLTGGSASNCPTDITFTLTVANGTSITGTTSLGASITGLSLVDSTVSGTTSDNTAWQGTINEDGVLSGNYNFDGGLCLGTLSGSKN